MTFQIVMVIVKQRMNRFTLGVFLEQTKFGDDFLFSAVLKNAMLFLFLNKHAPNL